MRGHGRFRGKKVEITDSSASGIFDTFSQYSYQKDSSWPSVSSVPVDTNNLILYLDPGNSGSYGGGTTWTDLSGQNNNTTLVGSPSHVSGTPSYFNLDANDDYINAGTALPDSYWQGTYTASIWIYFDLIRTSSNPQNPIFLHGSASTYKGLHLVQRSSRIAFALYNAAFQSASTVSVSTWYNITYTMNSSTRAAQIYINGSLDASNTFSSSYSGSGNNCRIADSAWNESTFPNLDGRIGEVFCYDAVLTSTQINSNYEATKTKYGL